MVILRHPSQTPKSVASVFPLGIYGACVWVLRSRVYQDNETDMKATTIRSEEGIEYVIRGGKLVEKCLHKTRRDESKGTMRKEVCNDCEKVLIYNADTTPKAPYRDTVQEAIDNFASYHGRQPTGRELSAMM